MSARYVMTSNNYYLRFQLDYIFYIELLTIRVKLGKFGHIFANNGNPDDTAPFTVCFINLFFIPIIDV